MRSQINLFCATPATVPVNRISVQNGGHVRITHAQGRSRSVSPMASDPMDAIRRAVHLRIPAAELAPRSC
jgi:hypothetical protein